MYDTRLSRHSGPNSNSDSYADRNLSACDVGEFRQRDAASVASKLDSNTGGQWRWIPILGNI